MSLWISTSSGNCGRGAVDGRGEVNDLLAAVSLDGVSVHGSLLGEDCVGEGLVCDSSEASGQSDSCFVDGSGRVVVEDGLPGSRQVDVNVDFGGGFFGMSWGQ